MLKVLRLTAESNSFRKSFVQRSIFIFAALFYIALALSNALTKNPEIDEGFFANPAFNLLNSGQMATTILETSGSALKGIDKHTYWIMPLQPLAQAAWYKLFGFSLFSMRGLSIAWGLIALLAWFHIMQVLSGNRLIALLTTVLLSIDYTFLVNAALGRMDMMCAALGFAGYAVYLVLRAKDLRFAVFASQSLIVASGLTHPNGFLHFVGLLFLTLYFDHGRLSWSLLLLAAVPYIVGATAWGLYILQDPTAFIAQFTMNSGDGGRLSGLTAPWLGIAREFTQRYPHAFGLTVHSAGHKGPIYLKSLILLPYTAAILVSVAVSAIRKKKGYKALLIIVAIYFLILSVIDGQKETPYLIHLFPFFVALLAVSINWCWNQRKIPRLLLVMIVAGFMALQSGGVLYRARQNTYEALYKPVISFLQNNARNGTSIFGPSGLGFGLQFSPQLKDDIRLGYYSGHKADFIVINEEYARSYAESRGKNQGLDQYIDRLLATEYIKVYENAAYTIYRRLNATSSASAKGRWPRHNNGVKFDS